MSAHGQWLLLQLLSGTLCRGWPSELAFVRAATSPVFALSGQLTIFATPLLAQRFASEGAEAEGYWFGSFQLSPRPLRQRKGEGLRYHITCAHHLKVDLNLGHVRLAGTAAVLGWPRYGDICEGSGGVFALKAWSRSSEDGASSLEKPSFHRMPGIGR